MGRHGSGQVELPPAVVLARCCIIPQICMSVDRHSSCVGLFDVVSCHTGNPAAAAAGLPLLAYDVIYASLLAEQGLVREATAYASAVQVATCS